MDPATTIALINLGSKLLQGANAQGGAAPAAQGSSWANALNIFNAFYGVSPTGQQGGNSGASTT